MNRKQPRRKSLMVKKYFSMLLGGTLTMMTVSVMLMSDSIIAGIFVGSDAVAGITLVTPVYYFAAFLGSLFSLGIPILYEKAIGQFDKEAADRLFGFGIIVSLLVGLILLVLLLLFGDLYLNGYHLSEGIRHHAVEYLIWMRLTIFLLPFQSFLAYMVYFDGDEFNTTLSNVAQGVGNIAASIFLCRIMGTYGIGLASFLFTVVAIAVLFAHFFKEKNSLHPRFCFSFIYLRQAFRSGVIDASSYLFLGLLTFILNWFVSRAFGPGYLILVSVIAICREFQLIYEGLSEAFRPILSTYLSENCLPGVRKIYYLAKYVAVIAGLGVTVLLVLIAPVLPGILDITDPTLADDAVWGTRAIAAGSLFVSLLYLSASYYLLLDRIQLGLNICGLRDSGEVFDLADSDMAVTSLRSYIVASYAREVSSAKAHLVAMSFNRNVFEIRRQTDSALFSDAERF